jgi:hypothetical protein
MATYDVYFEALLDTVRAGALDPLNTTGTVVLTSTTEDDGRYLETAVLELAEHYVRIVSNTGGFTVTPTGDFWREIQYVEE